MLHNLKSPCDKPSQRDAWSIPTYRHVITCTRGNLHIRCLFFSQERTRLAYLTDLYNDLLRMTLDSWCSLTGGSPEKATSSIFDSFKKMALKRISDNPHRTKISTSSSISSEGSRTPTQVCTFSSVFFCNKKTVLRLF